MTFPDYEGYEDLGSFTGPQELQAYRQMLLDKTNPQVEFIRKHVPVHNRVLEIGSGNGRLLIGLALQGLLEMGRGIELSRSRVDFARDWLRDYDRRQFDVGFWCGDALPITYTPKYYDLFVCITGCFQYMCPISPKAPMELLQIAKMSSQYSLFELYKRPPMGRTWRKLPECDPFSYLLDEYTDKGEWVEHVKTFIKRDGSTDTRSENLAYYTMAEFLAMLREAGFGNVHWARENDELMVVLMS